MPRQPEIAPPTIGYLKSSGITAVRVFCNTDRCQRTGRVTFEAIRRPDTLPFPDLRFRCTGCGGRDVSKQPEWPEVNASAPGWHHVRQP